MRCFGSEFPAIRGVRRKAGFPGWLALLASGLAWHGAAWANFVVTAPDGRAIVLKDDGSWRYEESAEKSKVDPKDKPEAVLQLMSKVELETGCRLVFGMENNLPYEIRSIVPFFSVFRLNGVMHQTRSVGFQYLRPGDKIERMLEFTGITCRDIARVQVTGGDRCDIGELHKYSADATGHCLAQIRVAPSDVTRFDK